MDIKIKNWLQIAQQISHFLSHPEDDSMEQEIHAWQKEKPAERQKILHELSQPEYYIRQMERQQSINAKYSWENFVNTQKQKRQRRKIHIFRYAAATLILLTAGSIFLFYPRPDHFVPSLVETSAIRPGGVKASLILANGEEISLKNKLTLTEEDGTLIHNEENGIIAYQKGNSQDSSLQYNTIKVPRGGEYRLILADGTRVWINSESELQFPTRFNGPHRNVYLKGEAYFEVAKDKQHPFYVHSEHLQILATGTAFNVNAYADEPEFKVILVEGGVNIEKNTKVLSRLIPNHQFSLDKQNGNIQVSEVDPRTATAWKNGSFFFNEESLESIIRKLSRWYNIDIQCDKPALKQYRFSGEIRKYENALQVLNMLKLTNEIDYSIEKDQRIRIFATD